MKRLGSLTLSLAVLLSSLAFVGCGKEPAKAPGGAAGDDSTARVNTDRPTAENTTADGPAVDDPITTKPETPTPTTTAVAPPAAKIDGIKNMEQNVVALHKFANEPQRFPRQAIADQTGKPLLSWRVALLPSLEQTSLHKQFKLDEPWDSSHNMKLAEEVVNGYSTSNKVPAGMSNILAVIGDDSIVHADQGARLICNADGLHNTIVFVEVAPDSAVPWTKPVDYKWDPSDPAAGLGLPEEETFIAGFADGQVRRISKNIDPEMLIAMFTKRGGEVVDLAALDGLSEKEADDALDHGATKVSSVNNMKQVMLALHYHHDGRKRFPAQAIADDEGKPLLSWRVVMLPYLGHKAFNNRIKFDEAWDSAHNSQLAQRTLPVYSTSDKVPPGMTNILAVIGDDSVLTINKGSHLTSILDGTASTIVLVEVAPGRAVPWAKPVDYKWNPNDPAAGLGLPDSETFAAVFADGSVRHISKKIDPKVLVALFTKSGGEVVDMDALDGPGED